MKVMQRHLILVFLALVACNLATEQSTVPEYYRPVDLDSLIKCQVVLPEGEKVAISNVQFRAIFISGTVHTRWQAVKHILQKEKPDAGVTIGEYVAAFKSRDSIFLMTLPNNFEGFDKNAEVEVKARMILFKMGSRDVRNFVVEDVEAISDVGDLSIGQSKALEDYHPVDMDSILVTPISLPESGIYEVDSVEFSFSSDEMLDITAPAPEVRDRFIQLNQLTSPGEHWEYKVGSVYFEAGDSSMTLMLGTPLQFYKLVSVSQDGNKVKLTIKAKMLTGKFKRYNATRDFLVQDILVHDN